VQQNSLSQNNNHGRIQRERGMQKRTPEFQFGDNALSRPSNCPNQPEIRQGKKGLLRLVLMPPKQSEMASQLLT
jgi:hypothetical protein